MAVEWIPHRWDDKPFRVNDRGYREIFYPTHPQARDGYFLEHRLVMENYINRFLNEDEVVHHVNEKKQDNRIENLFLTDNNEHSKIHRIGGVQSQRSKNKVRRQRQSWKFERDSQGRFKKKQEST